MAATLFFESFFPDIFSKSSCKIPCIMLYYINVENKSDDEACQPIHRDPRECRLGCKRYIPHWLCVSLRS